MLLLPNCSLTVIFVYLSLVIFVQKAQKENTMEIEKSSPFGLVSPFGVASPLVVASLPIKKKLLNKLHVAVLLINNPNLRKYRKSYLSNKGKEEHISEKEIKIEDILIMEKVPFISERKSEIPSENVENDGSFTKMKNYITEEPKTAFSPKK